MTCPFNCCLQNAHVALAFELPGGWLKERDAVILTVIQVCTHPYIAISLAFLKVFGANNDLLCRCLWEVAVHSLLVALGRGCTHDSVSSFHADRIAVLRIYFMLNL